MPDFRIVLSPALLCLCVDGRRRNLVGEEQADALDALRPAVHVIPEKPIQPAESENSMTTGEINSFKAPSSWYLEK